MNLVHVIVFLLSVWTCRLVAEICPSDWHRYGKSCYLMIKDNMDWYQANRTCAKSRANLFVPDLQSEQDYIWELFLAEFNPTADTFLWIGCNDIEEEGNWQHCPLKGETNAYKNWKYGEPNNAGNEDCGNQYMKNNGQWSDVECDRKGFAICELHVIDNRVLCLQTGNDGRLLY